MPNLMKGIGGLIELNAERAKQEREDEQPIVVTLVPPPERTEISTAEIPLDEEVFLATSPLFGGNDE